MQQPPVDQSPEMARHAGGKCPVTNKEANLDVTIEGSLSKIGRRHEDCLVVSDNRLGVEDALWTIYLDGPGIIVDGRSR